MKKFLKWTGIVLGGLIGPALLTGAEFKNSIDLKMVHGDTIYKTVYSTKIIAYKP